MIKQVDTTHAAALPTDATSYAPAAKPKAAAQSAKVDGTAGLATRALGAAMLLLSPAATLAAVDKPNWRGVAQRQLFGPAHGTTAQAVLGRQLLAAAQPSPAQPAAAQPIATSTYLVPKNAFNRTTGFLVLDVHGTGIDATLNNLTTAATEIFNIESNGQIVTGLLNTSSPQSCLGVASSHYANETPVWAEACNNQSNQTWHFANATGASDLQYYTISPQGEPKHAHYCLDVAHRSNAVGAKVQIYPCNGGDNQKWTFIFAG